MNKNNHGGNREGSGAKKKPPGQHKKIIAIYIKQDDIDALGGEKKLKEDIKYWIERSLREREKLNGVLEKLETLKITDWISTNEQLPPKVLRQEESRKVLVVMEGEVTTMKYNHVQGFWNTPCGTEKITYWQELPKTPQE